MKIAIIYNGKTGNTEKAAFFIKEGIEKVGRVDGILMSIENPLDAVLVKDCKAIIFGTDYSNVARQLVNWFDNNEGMKLAGKLGAAYATANTTTNGPERAIESILHHMLVKGMVVYAPGVGFDKPHMRLGPIGTTSAIDQDKELFGAFGERVAEKAVELFEPERHAIRMLNLMPDYAL